MTSQKPKQFKATKDTILKISEGVFGTATDLILYQMFLVGASIGKGSSPKDTYKIFAEAGEALEALNYQTIRQALYRLKRRGFIATAEGKVKEYRITKQGKERLKSLIPVYNKRRTWDKKIYLVTYDIPEQQKKDRELLRDFLKNIGCGMLQASVWLTPYNPRRMLEEFIEENKISGAIVVSDTGRDGSVGEQGPKELMAGVYPLDKLNTDYKDFIQTYKKYKRFKKDCPLQKIRFHYLSILKDDPQLPFELLPHDWKGDEAYHLFETLTTEERS